MGKIYINTDAVQNLKSNMYSKKNVCQSYSGRIYSVQNNLYWKVLNKRNIRTRLNNLRKRINRQSELLYSYSRVLGTLNNDMSDTDDRLRKDAKRITCRMNHITQVMSVCQNGSKRSKKIWGLNAKDYIFITSLFGSGMSGAALSTKVFLDWCKSRDSLIPENVFKVSGNIFTLLGKVTKSNDISTSATFINCFNSVYKTFTKKYEDGLSAVAGWFDLVKNSCKGEKGVGRVLMTESCRMVDDIPGVSRVFDATVDWYVRKNM